jgi:hypothetical protein
MDPKLRQKLIVSGVGLAVFIGLFTAAYIFYLGPRLKEWRENRKQVAERKERVEALHKEFGNQRDPRVELKTLEEEIQNLSNVLNDLKKIQTKGTEVGDLPSELNDPEEAIRRELYKDYMKQVMEVAGNKLKEKFKSGQISPPDLVLYEDLEKADEVAYYMNRAGGLTGIVEALAEAKTPESTLVVDNITLEDYETGIKRREGAVNVLSYLLNMTVDTQTLISFIYRLRDQENYNFLDEIEINPRMLSRSSGQQQLNVQARINTTMTFESLVKSQVQTVIAKANQGSAKASSGGSGFFALAMAIKKQQEEDALKEEETKWYEFWKWFKK